MKLDELRSNLHRGTMLSPPATVHWLRALNGQQRSGQLPALHQPTRWFGPASATIAPMKNGLAAAASPIFLLLLLSQKPAESGRFSREQQVVRFDGGLLPFSSIQDFGVTSAGASGSNSVPSAEGYSFAHEEDTESGALQLRHPNGHSGNSAGGAAALGTSELLARAGAGSSVVPADVRAQLPLPPDGHTRVPGLPTAQNLTVKKASRRLPEPASEGRPRGDSTDARTKAVAAGRSRARQRKDDVVGGFPGPGGPGEGGRALDTRRKATTIRRDVEVATTVSPARETHPTKAWELSRSSFGKTHHAVHDKCSRELHRRFSKMPPPLPHWRVLPALHSFEAVHGQLTLFFNGFSRRGSVVAYDLLDELRTVSEAQTMMDVEFLVLDRVMEFYGTPTHLRVVDTTVVHDLLDLSNLLPWRIPHLISSIRKLALEYQPVLQEFLNRYGPIIEALVLVKVPSSLKPLRPLIARLFNIPSEKLVLASDLSDLRDFIPLKYIPEEFGNPGGGKVRDGAENRMMWKIMLAEIAAKLGDDAVSPEGKILLEEYKKELERAIRSNGIKTQRSENNFTVHPKQNNKLPLLSAVDAKGISEDGSDRATDGRSDDVSGEGLWEKRIPLRGSGAQYQRASGFPRLDIVPASDDSSSEESDSIERASP